jgi:hypothetical protein
MLLEKEANSTDQLNNLRQITLTNCDLKIITKCFANRMSKVTNEVTQESQTAYIPESESILSLIFDGVRVLN